jgi:hypothetical protein
MRRILVSAAFGGLLVSGLAGTAVTAQAATTIRVATLGPYGVHDYTRYCVTGELVTVVVSGNGLTDLDLYVYSPRNQIVARDDDASDDCVVQFLAPETGFYTIKVVNRGGWSNTYTIGID